MGLKKLYVSCDTASGPALIRTNSLVKVAWTYTITLCCVSGQLVVMFVVLNVGKREFRQITMKFGETYPGLYILTRTALKVLFEYLGIVGNLLLLN